MTITLHGYWRSTASYRVRIALGLKGLTYGQVTHDLRTGAQRASAFLNFSPQGLVPALAIDGDHVTQSLAIMEWLEERWPEPALLPAKSYDRAIVRSMAQLVACDIHPLNNLRVLSALRANVHASEATIQAWIAHWIETGFAALEQLVDRHGRAFTFGDHPSLADCCLIPQIYSARRFSVDLSMFPKLVDIAARANQIDAFRLAAPDQQPDADSAPT
jgi:maleylpyruvate isomerase